MTSPISAFNGVTRLCALEGKLSWMDRSLARLAEPIGSFQNISYLKLLKDMKNTRLGIYKNL